MRFPSLVWTFVLTGCSSVVEQDNISYDDRFDTNVLDVYRVPSDVPRPGVLVVHGGGWTEGIYRSSMSWHAERLAEAGYVTFNIEYRLTPNGGQFPHEVQDCYCALAFVRENAAKFGVDPDRIAGLGYSAGGHLVSMLGVDRDSDVQPDCAAGTTGQLAAVVSGAGPQDMTKLPQVDVVKDFVGGSLDQVPALYASASPLTHVAAGDPPYLIIGGDDDWFVDFDDQARPMKAALDAVGTEARFLEIPGGGHIWNRGADDGDYEVALTSLDPPEAEAALIDFLDHTIGPVP